MTKFHKKLLWAGILCTAFIIFKLILLCVNDTTSTVICYFSSLFGVLKKFDLRVAAYCTFVYDMLMLWVTFLCYKRPTTMKFIGAICLYTGYLVGSGFYTIYSAVIGVRGLFSKGSVISDTIILCSISLIYILPVIAFIMVMLSQNEFIDFEEAVENGLIEDKSKAEISDTEG